MRYSAASMRALKTVTYTRAPNGYKGLKGLFLTSRTILILLTTMEHHPSENRSEHQLLALFTSLVIK